MRNVTLCLPMKKGKILLGNKKRGFGKDKLNGFGGKISESETIEEAAIRELYEEIRIKVNAENLKKVAELNFVFPYAKDKTWDQLVHVFLIEKWQGVPKESEEMTCEWFEIENIPFNKMWDEDKQWIPLVLSGKRIKAKFYFNEDNETTKSKEIFEVGKF